MVEWIYRLNNNCQCWKQGRDLYLRSVQCCKSPFNSILNRSQVGSELSICVFSLTVHSLSSLSSRYSMGQAVEWHLPSQWSTRNESKRMIQLCRLTTRKRNRLDETENDRQSHGNAGAFQALRVEYEGLPPWTCKLFIIRVHPRIAWT